MIRLQAFLRGVLAASVVGACALTFVWPFAVSADPADPAFRVLATGTLLAFLVSLAALSALRLRRAN